MVVVVVSLVAAATALAAVGLPSNGTPLNTDPSSDAGVSDIVGGSLAGGSRVPWATFEQKAGSAQLIFVRAFKAGSWVTQGASLNISPSAVAEAPSIDFAGANRTVPWDTWYEPNSALGGQKQIFASRFCAAVNAVCTAANTWVPEGQDRGSGVPSLNIHVDKEAENPSVAGGATVAGKDPVPWVAWQEQDGQVAGHSNRDQIFVSKGVKQPSSHQTCTGFKPSAAASVGVFCWQQVGLDRLAENGGSSSAGDPTLNVDPSRDGIEPDITFTGPNDTVAWVVWYETGASALGLHSNDQVFAAKLVTDSTADGGFHWQAVGNGTASTVNGLDTSGANAFGACAASTTSEGACSLNRDPTNNAQDPSVAAGTLTPGKPTVPWVVWTEDFGQHQAVFVSRLVGGNHFELFNGGNPLSNTHHQASHPDITFYGNVPYVSWAETVGSSTRGFVGHFEGASFVLDTPAGIQLARGGPPSLIDFRVPVSSSCAADPFTADGATCPGGAPDGTFFLFTRSGSPQRLFSEAVGPCTVISGCASTVSVQSQQAVVGCDLGNDAPVGILVDRILSQRIVHGHLVRRLKRVGRVPFGPKRHGKLRVHWDLRVNGHRLPPGLYLITLRAFDAHHRVIALARPVVIRIRH
jgi:hypothetical protein